MARSRRRSSMPRRRRAQRDWVYTDDAWRDESFLFPQNAGPAAASIVVLPLVYSVNARRQIMFGARNVLAGPNQLQGGYAAPELPRQIVYGVEGHALYNPSTWALGSEFRWGWQLIIGTMEPQNGDLIADTNQSMWVSAPGTHIAQWRNSRAILAEGRWYRNFGENTSNGAWRTEVRWSSSRGRALDEDEGLFLWLEGSPASVNTARNRVFVRTLMKRPD